MSLSLHTQIEILYLLETMTFRFECRKFFRKKFPPPDWHQGMKFPSYETQMLRNSKIPYFWRHELCYYIIAICDVTIDVFTVATILRQKVADFFVNLRKLKGERWLRLPNLQRGAERHRPDVSLSHMRQIEPLRRTSSQWRRQIEPPLMKKHFVSKWQQHPKRSNILGSCFCGDVWFGQISWRWRLVFFLKRCCGCIVCADVAGGKKNLHSHSCCF